MRVSSDQQREYSLNLVYVTWRLATANRSRVSIHITEMFGLDKGCGGSCNIFLLSSLTTGKSGCCFSCRVRAHVGGSEIWGCWAHPLWFIVLSFYTNVVLLMAARGMREWSCDGSALARCPNTRSRLCDNWCDWGLTCSTPHFFAGDMRRIWICTIPFLIQKSINKLIN